MPRKTSVAAQARVVNEVVTAEDGAVANLGKRLSTFEWDRRGSVDGGERVDFQRLVDQAQDATDMEHRMGVWEAVKLYPKAVAWSVLVSTALIMEGYDLVVIGSFFAFPAFTQKYGIQLPNGSYSVTAAWQSGLSTGATIGEMLGLMITGIVAERFGYRKTIAGALIAVICFIFITFFAPSIEVLLVGEMLCGLPWGVFQTITTAYAAEVTPVALRHVLTTYVNLCWVLGQITGSGVLRGLVTRNDQWGYRIPFALQWMWPIPLLVGICFAPESPWWLVRRNQLERAEHALRRLTSSKYIDFDPQKTIAMMIHTNELEKETVSGTSYWDCFKGTDLRRTEIACMVWMIQILCGCGLVGASAQFFQQAGLDPVHAFDLSMGMYAVGAVGTVAAWFVMTRVGRRTLYLFGLLAMFTVLLIVGFLAIPGPNNTGAVWASGSMLLIFNFLYDFTVGPVCYCVVAEVSSVRLRQKTIVLARNAYNIMGIVNFVLTPRMLNPTGWNWRGYSGFFWAGTCFLSIVWTYFRLPETKGKTYAEMDVLFERRVSARKFATTAADPFRGETLEARHGSIVRIISRDSGFKNGKGRVNMVEKIESAL